VAATVAGETEAGAKEAAMAVVEMVGGVAAVRVAVQAAAARGVAKEAHRVGCWAAARAAAEQMAAARVAAKEAGSG